MISGRPYVGRFAPSPTGRLHLGSMVAAVASYLDARVHGGRWLVRIEDLDPTREVKGVSSDILRTLEGFGLGWDGPVVYQSTRHEKYREALDSLMISGLAFGCACTRKTLAKADGSRVYPGFCRSGLPKGTAPRSWRFKMPRGVSLSWHDRVVGRQSYSPDSVGDVTLLRADGHWAYHLAVVVDDADQEVTDIVRGADLISSTAAHVGIQRALGILQPKYAHVPLVLNAEGQKLSKQTLARPVEIKDSREVLSMVFKHLNLPDDMSTHPRDMMSGAIKHWGKKWKEKDE